MADNVKDLFKQALKFTQEGKLDKAIEAYRAIIKKTPKDTRVLNNLGDLFLRKKMSQEAAGIFSDLALYYDEDGYTLRAIAICQKVLKIDPESTPAKVRMADLYAKQGLVAEARNAYLELANHYDKKGQIKDALEVFRKLADLDPTNLSVRSKLGNMFHKEKLAEKAAIEWTKAAEGYLKNQQAAEARELLQKAVEAYPEGIRARTLLAGEEIRQDQSGRAIELLAPIVEGKVADQDTLKLYAAALLKSKQYKKAAEVLRKALEKEPSSLPVKENLGLALLKSGQLQEATDILLKIIAVHTRDNRWDRAEKLAGELKGATPEDPQVVQRLVEIHLHTGNRQALVAAYLDLAALYEKKNLKKNVVGIYEKLLELDPQRAEWRHILDELQRPPVAAPTKKPEPVVEEGKPAAVIQDEELGVLATAGQDVQEEIESEVDQEVFVAETPEDFVQGLLRKGLFKEAETRLLEMIKKEPALGRLRLLKEVYRLKDRVKAYVKTCFDIALFLDRLGRKRESIAEYQDILRMDQGNQEAKEAMADLVVEFGVEAPTQEELETPPPPPREERVSGVVEIPEVDLETAGELDLEKLAGELSARETARLEEAPAAVPESAPEPEEPLDATWITEALEALEGSPVQAVPVVETPVSPPVAPKETPAPQTAEVELEDLVAEADFYYQQGLYEEAERLYRVILTRDPGRLDVASRLSEVSSKTKPEEEAGEVLRFGDQDLEDFERVLDLGLPQPKKEVKFSVAPESLAKPAGGGLDFSDFLSSLKEEVKDEVEAPPPPPPAVEEESLQAIFQEFQQGVRANLSEEDYETHYNLGIAYKEMGLLDEAMAEFEMAAKSPDFYIDAVSMRALVCRDKGEPQEAIRVLEEALENLDPGDEGRKGLLWELAGIHEELGEKLKTVNLYLSVFEMDDSYRSVREKLKELGVSPEPEAPEEPAAPQRHQAAQPKEEKPAGKKSTKVSYI